VLVEVEETNTGSFALGGAVSSDSGVVGRIALTQRNFDITDTPDSFGDLFSGRAFRGGGQTLQVEALPGDRSETYSISLSEPYLFETDYSGSGSIYYRSRDYRQYDEVRVGARLGLGRRFGTLWTGGVSLRVEGIELEDIEEDRPVDIFEVEGSNHITGIGFTLSRNTLDDPYRPTRGAATRAGIEQVGALGGDFTFTSIDAEHRVFIPLRRDYLDRATVLSLTTRVGYIPQGQDDVPIFERYYLGGQSFRGFDFRTVSPKGIRNDTGEQGDDPIGGTWLFFAGLELNQPIFEDTLSLVFFVDTGTVLEEPGFEDYRVSVGVGIRFYVPQLSPAPLAFDFGFPILDADLDEDRLFTFSIDLPL
jgi:outer membrane protein insertion porin family